MNTKLPLLIIILIASGLLGYFSLTKAHDWGGDFSAYIMQARSIVDGTMDEYVEKNSVTFMNSDSPVGPITYPWGFPTLLAPLYYVFGFNLIAFKVINILFYGLFLLCLFFLFRKRMSYTSSLIILSVFAFNPAILGFHDNILSDIPFLFASTLSIFLIDRIVVANQKLVTNLIDQIILGLTIFFAFFIRGNGILLLIALLICQGRNLIHILFNKKKELKRTFFIYLLPYSVFVTLVILSRFVYSQGETPYIARIIGRLFPFDLPYIGENFIMYSGISHEFFRGLPGHKIVYMMSLIFLIVGVIKNIRKDYLFAIYPLLTLLLYVFWPARQGFRFVLPALPFFIYFVLKGILWSNSVLARRFQKTGYFISVTVYAFIFVCFLQSSISLAHTNILNNREKPGPFDPVSMGMFNFISTQTKPEDIIVFFKPRVLSMITGRNAIKVVNQSQLNRGDYLVLHKYFNDHYDSDNPSQVSPTEVKEESKVNKLKKIFENEKFIVFRIM